MRNNRFALLQNEYSTEKQNGTSNSAPKSPPIFLREASSNKEIKEALEELGYSTKNVTNIFNKNKVPNQCLGLN